MSALTVSLMHLAGNCSTARSRVSLFILRQRYENYWNFLRNPSSRRLLEMQRPELSGAQQHIVRDLRSHGLSFARFTELGTDAKHSNRLRETVDSFARSAKVKEAIENTPRSWRAAKWPDAYIVKLNEEGPTFGIRFQ